MIYVDSALLNLIEAACRRFQVLTGRTNVWLAFQLTNLSIVVYFVLAAVYFWSSPAVARIALVLFCGGLLYLLTQTIFKITVEAHESSAYQRVAKGFRNPRRVSRAPCPSHYPSILASHFGSDLHLAAFELFADCFDHVGAISAGLRSTSAVRWTYHRLDSSVDSRTAKNFSIGGSDWKPPSLRTPAAPAHAFRPNGAKATRLVSLAQGHCSPAPRCALQLL
jgi:hypothetical protein